MLWSLVVAVISIAASSYCINRPVYKIVLTQKGFSQFIQYDIETPAIREFTFCTWIRLYHLDNEQGLFSYVVNGNHVIRLWLDSGGNFIKVSINEKSPSMVAVDIARDSWRHICLSYQSDYGSWALYLDGRFIHCETSQNLYNYVLPGGGSVIIGYGSSNVILSGLEGELFGANMILSSTIERNHTLKEDPLYEQKRFAQNKVIGNRNLKYIVLGELDSMTIKNNYETSVKPIVAKVMQNFKKFLYPFSHSEHIISLETTSLHPKLLYIPNGKGHLDFSETDYTGTTDKFKINFWSLVNTEKSKLKSYNKNTLNDSNKVEQSSENSILRISSSSTMTTLTHKNIFAKLLQHNNQKDNLFQLSENIVLDNITFVTNKLQLESSDVRVHSNSNNQMGEYNKWKSSRLAGNVLNYHKRIKFSNKEPLKIHIKKAYKKNIDNFQSLNNLKETKVKSSLQLLKQNLSDKYFDKREVLKTFKNISNENNLHKKRQHNVSKHNKKVDINSSVKYISQKHKRQINEQELIKYQINEENDLTYPISAVIGKLNKSAINLEKEKENSNLTFIKSVDYFSEDVSNTSDEILKAGFKTSDIFTRSLIKGNKWHNVHTFNNDYTPHRLNMEFGVLLKNTDISEANKKLPSVRIKYKHDKQRLLVTPSIIEGRALAKAISNQSSKNDTFSILKYNSGFLSNGKGNKRKFKTEKATKKKLRQSLPKTLESINGNMQSSDTLNKNPIISKVDKFKINLEMGYFEDRFNETRSNKKNATYIGTKFCTKFQMNDHFLYVQPDGSIDITHIVSPVKERNIGIEFIMQNYKRCSLQDSYLEKNNLIFLNWNKTPVRLFGGAYPKKTTDLCGFF